MACLRWSMAALLAAAGIATTVALGSADAPLPTSANPIPALAFTPPAAGTYRLERIMRAPDGRVLNSDGSVHRLREFTTGRITLFSLIYTYCTDARGCPLAYATLHALKNMLAAHSALHGRVRFVSMSFDPQFDTPAMMRSYGGDDAAPSPATPWYFLTTASKSDLAPVLDGFGQDLAVIGKGAAGVRAPVLAHLLKVYLIDRSGAVREIYTTAYLHPTVICNDIASLLLEQGGAPPPGYCGGGPASGSKRLSMSVQQAW